MGCQGFLIFVVHSLLRYCTFGGTTAHEGSLGVDMLSSEAAQGQKQPNEDKKNEENGCQTCIFVMLEKIKSKFIAPHHTPKKYICQAGLWGKSQPI